jgi:hypothetical protein
LLDDVVCAAVFDLRREECAYRVGQTGDRLPLLDQRIDAIGAQRRVGQGAIPFPKGK